MDHNREIATLAGGCFWCLEAVYENLKGVEKVVSGYAGGTVPSPSYEAVCTGRTGHAEVVQITFDPKVVTFRELLEVFFTIHDPTTLNRQGNDIGTQYRSAIYYHSPQQKADAEAVMAELSAQGLWNNPIVTELAPAPTFYPAEEYHQHYFARNPTQGYCSAVVAPKVAKFRKHFLSKLKAVVIACLAFALAPSGLRAQIPVGPDSAWVRTEAMIRMRDGVQLYAAIVRPRNQSGPLPIIMERTPYEADAEWKHGFPTSEFRELANDGYIFVFNDIRGKYRSQGQFVMNHPLRPAGDTTGIDETTDTYDVIEWLVHNVPNTTGKVGVLGISYPGWLTTMAGIHPHPALKAISPQAPMTDAWMGDDFFHHGAFRLSYGLEYSVSMESGNEFTPFDVGTYDMYDWYLRLGPLSNVAAHAFPGGRPTWNAFVAHPAYDEYWQSRAADKSLTRVNVPTLTVGGWWDQEDRYGALQTYAVLEHNDAASLNRLAMGPWNHGGWAGPTGNALGALQFGSNTSQYFREHVEAPFFAFYLKDRAPLSVAEATVFETGSNQWRTFDHWPPREATTRNLYLHANGAASFEAPTSAAAAADSFVSDPAHPVPYRARPIQPTYYPAGSQWYTWEVADQRFVDNRPDVLTWRTAPLDSDVVIAGDVTARLFASTTGTDADWVVKVIDEYPPRDSANERMGGYELMVAYEILRGRYRTSWERPAPIARNQVLPYTIDLHQQSYRFKRGHRITVQIQSTWFPLYDRNPQTFVPNIFNAREADFHAQTHRIWRSGRYATHIELPVIPR